MRVGTDTVLLCKLKFFLWYGYQYSLLYKKFGVFLLFVSLLTYMYLNISSCGFVTFDKMDSADMAIQEVSYLHVLSYHEYTFLYIFMYIKL